MILSSTSKFWINWESITCVRLSQSLYNKICVKFTKSSYFYDVINRTDKSYCHDFFTKHIVIVYYCVWKVSLRQGKWKYSFWIEKSIDALAPPPIDTAILQKSWIHNPLTWLNYRTNSSLNKAMCPYWVNKTCIIRFYQVEVSE